MKLRPRLWGGFFILSLYTFLGREALGTNFCPWYLVQPTPHSIDGLVERIDRVLKAVEGSMPYVSTDRLRNAVAHRAIQGAEDLDPEFGHTVRSRLATVLDLLIHLANELAQLKDLPPQAYPFLFHLEIDPDKLALSEVAHDKVVQFSDLNSFVEFSFHLADVHLRTGKNQIPAWHFCLSFFIDSTYGFPLPFGPLGTAAERVLSKEDIEVLDKIRNLFQSEPGQNPKMPGIRGNYTKAQKQRIYEALEAQGYGPRERAALLRLPFFSGASDEALPVYQMMKRSRLKGDLSLVRTILKGVSVGRAEGGGGSLQQMSEGDLISLALKELAGEDSLMNPTILMRRYLGDVDYKSVARWRYVRDGIRSALELVKFSDFWETMVQASKSKHVRFRKITDADIQLIKSEALEQKPRLRLKPREAHRFEEAERSIGEVFRSAHIGEEFKEILERYLLTVHSLKLDHVRAFPTYLHTLQKIAGIKP